MTVFVTFSDSFIFFSYLMVSSIYCAVPTSHMTVLLSHSMISLYCLTFYSTIFTLYSINITYKNIFVTFFFFSSHLMVTFPCHRVPRSYLTALLSYGSFNFFPLLWYHLQIGKYSVPSLWLSSSSLSLSQFFYSLRFSLQFHLSQILLVQTIHKNLSRATITKQTLSKTHKRRNRSLSHERYLTNSSEGILIAKQ